MHQAGSFMRLILYASRSRIEAGSTALIDILGAAVRNNFLAGVTGALYYDGAAFLQALEGP
ncbi:MAG: BLUF domain-containing protein, partial [Rubrimonas sp.]